MIHDVWLMSHPYLEPIARFHALVERAVEGIPPSKPSIPSWHNYIADFYRGVPLLLSTGSEIEYKPAEKMLATLVEQLAAGSFPDKTKEEAKLLNEELHESSAPRRAVGWLLNKDVFESACPGLLRYLGWTTLARHFRPIIDAFAIWRHDEPVLRRYCPTCGFPPAMAQLVGEDPGRRRFLSCGHCGTRWYYRRTGCPFCENWDDHRLTILAVEGEGGLRIDYCESCNGYLKTYNGRGNESVLLADWTSIHLDLVAQDRGLRRLAASLYEL